MAGDNYDPNMGNQAGNGDSTDWWTQNAPDTPAPGNDANQIQGWYSQFLGRNATDAEIQSHLGNPGGLSAVQNLIANSPEAQAYAGRGRTDTGGGGTGASEGGGGGAAPPTWGGPIAPYGGPQAPVFTPPPLPDYLQKGFTLPSAEELQATPGYMERFRMGQQARERASAARGTILNGGTQQALTRYGQDYATGEYNNLAQQKLGERQQQSADYLNLAYGPAWQQNQSAQTQYGNLYSQYKDLTSANRGAQSDYWNQQLDLLNAGLRAASAGSPGSTGA
jgi:hypothetical protein